MKTHIRGDESRYCGHEHELCCSIVAERNVKSLDNLIDWYNQINPGEWDTIPHILYEIDQRSIKSNDNCFLFNGNERRTPYIRGLRVQEILWPMAYAFRNDDIKLTMVCGRPGCVNPFHMAENDLLYRIEQKVKPVQRPGVAGPCLVWQGNLAPKKGVPRARWYPRIEVSTGKQRPVHIVVIEQVLEFALPQEVIAEGEVVRHLCGYPDCVASYHLALGDHMANMRDRDRHGRTACGERNGNSKVTDIERVAIHNSQLSNAELSEMFNIHRETVRRIKRSA